MNDKTREALEFINNRIGDLQAHIVLGCGFEPDNTALQKEVDSLKNVRAALEAQSETVDVEGLKVYLIKYGSMGYSALHEGNHQQQGIGYNKAIDHIAENYHLTRKEK